MTTHGDRPFDCTHCPYASRLYSRTQRHIREVHEKNNFQKTPRKTPQKNEQKTPPKRQSSFMKKLEGSPNNSHKKHKCSLCPYGTDTQSRIVDHYSIMHKLGAVTKNNQLDPVSKNEE